MASTAAAGFAISALVGIVKESNTVATVVEIPAKESRLVTVLPHSGRGPRAAVGSRVLVLGAIVADPSVNLEGYEGDESQIVLETLHVVLPDSDDEKPAPVDKPPATEKPADEKPVDKDAPSATPAAKADESPASP